MIQDQSLRIMFALALAMTSLMGCESARESTRSYLFFPPPPAKPRIQFLTWANGSGDVLPERSAFEKAILGEDLASSRTIEKPYGLAAHDGSIYVCDTKRLDLVRFDFKNKVFSVIGRGGPGKLRKPINMVIDPLGYKFVADSVRKQIVVFGPQDEFVTAFDVPEPCHPVDVAVSAEEVYVLDNDSTCRIVVLDRATGRVLRSFGDNGSEPGQFNVPGSLCLDEEGNVYVSDTLNFRIQKLDPEGNPIWVRGNPGYRLGEFGRPRGIRVGPDNVIYVIEGAMEIVQMLDAEGNTLMRFGGPGTQPGSLLLPAGIAVDATSIPYFQEYIHDGFRVDYLLFVANQYGDYLINIYAYGSFPKGAGPAGSTIRRLPPVEIEKSIGPAGEAPGASPAEGNDPRGTTHLTPLQEIPGGIGFHLNVANPQAHDPILPWLILLWRRITLG